MLLAALRGNKQDPVKIFRPYNPSNSMHRFLTHQVRAKGFRGEAQHPGLNISQQEMMCSMPIFHTARTMHWDHSPYTTMAQSIGPKKLSEYSKHRVKNDESEKLRTSD